MNILFVNRFFAPDISATSQLLSDLAFHLANQHTVYVITSRLRYEDADSELPRLEHVRGVTVHRVWTSRFGRGSLAGRSIDYLTFYVSATLRLLRLARRGDLVVAMTDPPLISIPVSAAARLRGARVVNWLQDIFPEVAGELDFKRMAGTARTLARLRNQSLAAAACNVVVGELMASRVSSLAATDRIRIIPNWASGEHITPVAPVENPLRREWDLSDKYVVGYSGNMGRAHDFASLLDAAERLRARSDIVFLFVGGGKQLAMLMQQARTRRLDNVIFRPYAPQDMRAASLSAADCHIVSLKPALEGLIVPSKIYSSMAAGRPVIFIGAPDGEIARLMKSGPPFGMVVSPDDVDGLITAIERLADDRDSSSALGRRGRRVFEESFDQPIAMAKWTALIAELCPGA